MLGSRLRQLERAAQAVTKVNCFACCGGTIPHVMIEGAGGQLALYSVYDLNGVCSYCGQARTGEPLVMSFPLLRITNGQLEQ